MCLESLKFQCQQELLLDNDVITELLEEEVNLARKRKLLSDEHFSVDGTLDPGLGVAKELPP